MFEGFRFYKKTRLRIVVLVWDAKNLGWIKVKLKIISANFLRMYSRYIPYYIVWNMCIAQNV